MFVLESMKYICLFCTIILVASVTHTGCVKTDAVASLDSNVDAVASLDSRIDAVTSLESKVDAVASVDGTGVGNRVDKNNMSQNVKESKETNQTLNTGFMAGGAPWLFMAIIAILYAKERTVHKRETKRADNAEIKTQELNEEVDILKKRNTSLKVQNYQDAVRRIDKNETE